MYLDLDADSYTNYLCDKLWAQSRWCVVLCARGILFWSRAGLEKAEAEGLVRTVHRSIEAPVCATSQLIARMDLSQSAAQVRRRFS